MNNPPTVAHHRLLSRLRAKRGGDPDSLYEMSDIEAARALAASEDVAVQDALAMAKAKEKMLRLTISELRATGRLTQSVTADLLLALK